MKPEITNTITKTFGNMEVRLEISDTSEKFQYRLVAKLVGIKVGHMGDWSSDNHAPYFLRYKGRTFVSFPAYWGKDIPTEQPLEIIAGK